MDFSSLWQPQLIEVSARSVVTVIACSGVGAYARKQGAFDKKAEKTTDKLIQAVFLPSLILAKVVPNFTLEGLRHVWPMGVMCIAVVIYGLLSGRVLSFLLGLRYSEAGKKYRGLMMVALSFPNSFSVPMTLALALGEHPVLLKDGQGEHELSHRINVLFLLSYALWVLARWSIGYPILSGALSFKEWQCKVLNPPVIACLMAGAAGLLWSEVLSRFISDRLCALLLGPLATALEYSGRCSVPMILMALGARLVSAMAEVWEALKRLGYSQSEEIEKIVVPHAVSGPEAAVIGGAAEDVEACNSGNVNSKATAAECNPTIDTVGAAQAPVRMPLVAFVAILVLRQLVGPAFGAAIACRLLRDLMGVHDNVVLFVCLLQSAGPPMINLSVMAGLSGSAEVETAKLLLLTYAFSIFSWTASITAFLWLLQ